MGGPGTCDVGYPTVSRLAALTQTTVPLMEEADVVLGEASPQVPGRNWSQTGRSAVCRPSRPHTSVSSLLTLLWSIILVWLALPLPDVTVNVVKIVRGDVTDAVELQEVGLCGQRADERQQPPHHRGTELSATGEKRRETAAGLRPHAYEERFIHGRPARWVGVRLRVISSSDD